MSLPFQELGTWIPDALFELRQNHCCRSTGEWAVDGPRVFSLGLAQDVRTSLREFRSEFSEEQQSSVKCLQDFRSSIRDFRSDLDEQRESLKVLQETDLVKHLGEARQVLADLQEERSWHHEAMKKLRESREDAIEIRDEHRKSYEEEVSDLEKRTENFRQMLQSALPMELDKRDQTLTKQTEEVFEKLQSWTQGRVNGGKVLADH
eukprot:s2921_g4.t1